MSSFNHTLSAILRGRWMIEHTWAMDHMPLVIAMLEGKNVSFVKRTGNADIELPFVVDPATMNRYNFYNYGMPNPNIPPNSVAIMPINGPLTKYNGDCGEPGMILRSTWLMDMLKRDNISAIVQLIDTPGGESRASTTYANLVSNSSKPVLSFIDDMCCSLGMWFCAAGDESYASHDLASIGSIGTYATLADYTGYFEKMGIKLTEIYAPQSTDKNKDYKGALSGDPASIKAIEDELGLLVDKFISFVSTQRGDKALQNQSAWNSGKVFHSADATKLGLIDGVKSFDQVVSKAAWLSKRK